MTSINEVFGIVPKGIVIAIIAVGAVLVGLVIKLIVNARKGGR